MDNDFPDWAVFLMALAIVATLMFCLNCFGGV